MSKNKPELSDAFVAGQANGKGGPAALPPGSNLPANTDPTSQVAQNISDRLGAAGTALQKGGGAALLSAETLTATFLSALAEGYAGPDKLKIAGVDSRIPVGLVAELYGIYRAATGKVGGEHLIALGEGVLGGCVASMGMSAGKSLRDKQLPAGNQKPAGGFQGEEAPMVRVPEDDEPARGGLLPEPMPPSMQGFGAAPFAPGYPPFGWPPFPGGLPTWQQMHPGMANAWPAWQQQAPYPGPQQGWPPPQQLAGPMNPWQQPPPPPQQVAGPMNPWQQPPPQRAPAPYPRHPQQPPQQSWQQPASQPEEVLEEELQPQTAPVVGGAAREIMLTPETSMQGPLRPRLVLTPKRGAAPARRPAGQRPLRQPPPPQPTQPPAPDPMDGYYEQQGGDLYSEEGLETQIAGPGDPHLVPLDLFPSASAADATNGQ